MKKTTGQRLREVRGAATQAEFADLLGVSRKTWIRYEADERDPDVEMIVKLNLLFGVQPLWLLTGDESIGAGIRLDATEGALLRDYRQCNEQGRSAIAQMARALATASEASVAHDAGKSSTAYQDKLAEKPKPAAKKRAPAKKVASATATNSAPGGIAIGSNLGRVQNTQSGDINNDFTGRKKR